MFSFWWEIAFNLDLITEIIQQPLCARNLSWDFRDISVKISTHSSGFKKKLQQCTEYNFRDIKVFRVKLKNFVRTVNGSIIRYDVMKINYMNCEDWVSWYEMIPLQMAHSKMWILKQTNQVAVHSFQQVKHPKIKKWKSEWQFFTKAKLTPSKT